jgi:deoxyribonuclease (pyrimidine dimer)
MTRINTIPPQELCDKHLMAEIREITRIPNTVKSGKARIEGIPETFRLGSGHVKFFYDKIFYLQKRYKQLYDECQYRGFNVQDNSGSFKGIPIELMNDWTPTPDSIKLIRERLEEKFKVMKNIKYTNR